MKTDLADQLKHETPADGVSGKLVETALKLSGKSDEEATKTGKLDRADEQVEALFAPRYQTSQSPIHRAVWSHDVPVDLFCPEPVSVPEGTRRVMEASLDVVRRHRAAGTVLDKNKKVSGALLRDLAGAGYWGLLVDPEYGGHGGAFLGLCARS